MIPNANQHKIAQLQKKKSGYDFQLNKQETV
jgi:hypothetical protein